MNRGAASWTIVGQGLAGTCLAWSLWCRKLSFRIVDSGKPGSSFIAAGMINPITGKNFEPSWRIAEFLPEAIGFYQYIEIQLGRKFWIPMPVLRLAATDKEWNKIESKLNSPDVAPWITAPVASPPGWTGAVELRGGGRLNVSDFLEASREFFQSAGCYETTQVSGECRAGEIRCEGAVGLLDGSYGSHRCAKGEILTVRAHDWDENRIRVGAGGWLVPIGGGYFKAGSTYQWDHLDTNPTTAGRERIEEIAARLGGPDFEVTEHVAGIRPILRRSQPLIGRYQNGWMFNALGSKGSLYAPGMADRLAACLADGTEPEPELDFQKFLAQSRSDG